MRAVNGAGRAVVWLRRDLDPGVLRLPLVMIQNRGILSGNETSIPLGF